jgi:hypothetical protein
MFKIGRNRPAASKQIKQVLVIRFSRFRKPLGSLPEVTRTMMIMILKIVGIVCKYSWIRTKWAISKKRTMMVLKTIIEAEFKW